MIKKIFKVIGILLLSLIGFVLLAYVYIYFDINLRSRKTYNVTPEPIRVTYDSAAIVRGERLTRTRACQECHGSDLGGAVIFEDPMIGSFVAKNITKGKGGLPQDFSEQDWVMAIKHGLKRDKTPLYIMPSHELSLLSEKDMGDIIAYCSQLTPVDREMPVFRIGPLGNVLTKFGLIPLLPAENTDHHRSFAKEVAPDISIEHGKYLSMMCVNCHGPKLKGGESPVPGGKLIADISSTGKPGKWSHAQFVTALTKGKTPEGKMLDPTEMPWTITKNYTEDELTALHMYLQTVK